MIPIADRAYWRNPYFAENRVTGRCSCSPLVGPDGRFYHNDAPRCPQFKTHCFRCKAVIGERLGNAIDERPTSAEPFNFFIHCKHCPPTMRFLPLGLCEGEECPNCCGGKMVGPTFDCPWTMCNSCGFID